MKTFRRETETILRQLKGSAWATHPKVRKVHSEYEHLLGAWKVIAKKRRSILQVVHASRAIDSMLRHIAEHEILKAGRTGKPKTIGASLNEIQTHGVGGSYNKFTLPTERAIKAIKNSRNRYLHRADEFPGESEIQRFVMRAVRAMNEACAFPP